MAEVQPLIWAAGCKCRAIHRPRMRGRSLLTPPDSEHIARIGRISLRLWEIGRNLTNQYFKCIWLIDLCSSNAVIRKYLQVMLPWRLQSHRAFCCMYYVYDHDLHSFASRRGRSWGTVESSKDLDRRTNVRSMCVFWLIHWASLKVRRSPLSRARYIAFMASLY